MSTLPPQVAIVYPGDSEIRRLATPENNRYAALFAAFASRGVKAHPAVYNRAQANELRDQLLALDGALVWVNPIEAGHSRATLDAVLREVAGAGVFVSTHPDVIMKLGTKDVLVATREMGWGSDVYRLDTLAQLREELAERLRAGSSRVLKQWRGHSGIGVWRVERAPGDATVSGESRVLARHAQRGGVEIAVTFDEFASLMAPCFEDGGHMIDQAWPSPSTPYRANPHPSGPFPARPNALAGTGAGLASRGLTSAQPTRSSPPRRNALSKHPFD